MRGIVIKEFGGPEVLTLEEDMTRPITRTNQVLIKVHSAGINPVDTYIRSGTYAIVPELPYTPGNDCAGTVEEVGPGVTDFTIGDRVFALRTLTGSYAEYALCESAMVRPLPDNVTFEEGAGVGIPCYTAYRALILKGQAKKGDKVLIHGASGAVGLACVQICKAKGIDVIGTAGSAEGIELVKKMGAYAAFNHRLEGYTAQILTATNEEGPDLIIEMVANVNLQIDLDIVKKFGRIVIIGSQGNTEVTPRTYMQKECTVTGMTLMGSPHEDWLEMYDRVQEGVKEGWLKPYISKRYKLEEASKAHDDMVFPLLSLGKRVIVMDQEPDQQKQEA